MNKLYKTTEAIEVFKDCILPIGSKVQLDHSTSCGKYHYFKLLGIFKGCTMFIDKSKLVEIENIIK